MTVICYDGRIRSGRIVYRHPKGRYSTIEFEGKAGRWREAIIPYGRSFSKTAHKNTGHKPVRREWTATEMLTVSSLPAGEAAQKLGRSYGAVLNMRKQLGIVHIERRFRKKPKGHKK